MVDLMHHTTVGDAVFFVFYPTDLPHGEWDEYPKPVPSTVNGNVEPRLKQYGDQDQSKCPCFGHAEQQRPQGERHPSNKYGQCEPLQQCTRIKGHDFLMMGFENGLPNLYRCDSIGYLF